MKTNDRSSAVQLREQESREQSMCFGRAIRWPVARVAGVEVSVAMSLPLGLFATLVLGIAIHAADGVPTASGNAHTLWLAWLIGFWCAGLFAQLALAIWFMRFSRVHRANCILTIGGVWAAPPQRPHGVSLAGVLMIWSLVMLSLGIGSLAFITISYWSTSNTLPGWGVAWLDDPWAAAAWLWCLQAVWNLLPLPQSLGRVGWAMVIALLGGGPNHEAKRCLRTMRAWVVVVSLLTLVGGNVLLQTLGVTSQPGGLAWPAIAGVVALSLWLFTSSGSADLDALYASIVRRSEYVEVGERNPIGRLRGQVGPMASWRRFQAKREAAAQQQRLREAMESEHREAADASKVDEVLQRLHRNGVASISSDERALLQRVSDALRRQREQETPGGSAAGSADDGGQAL